MVKKILIGVACIGVLFLILCLYPRPVTPPSCYILEHYYRMFDDTECEYFDELPDDYEYYGTIQTYVHSYTKPIKDLSTNNSDYMNQDIFVNKSDDEYIYIKYKNDKYYKMGFNSDKKEISSGRNCR